MVRTIGSRSAPQITPLQLSVVRNSRGRPHNHKNKNECGPGPGQLPTILVIISVLTPHFFPPYLSLNSSSPYDHGPCCRIKHYAGSVTYTVAGFLGKNSDTLAREISCALHAAGHPLLRTLFPEGNYILLALVSFG